MACASGRCPSRGHKHAAGHLIMALERTTGSVQPGRAGARYCAASGVRLHDQFGTFNRRTRSVAGANQTDQPMVFALDAREGPSDPAALRVRIATASGCMAKIVRYALAQPDNAKSGCFFRVIRAAGTCATRDAPNWQIPYAATAKNHRFQQLRTDGAQERIMPETNIALLNHWLTAG